MNVPLKGLKHDLAHLRSMDINTDDLPFVINACLVLHNFCEINKESISEERARMAIDYDDRDFRSPTAAHQYRSERNEVEGNRMQAIFLLSTLILGLINCYSNTLPQYVYYTIVALVLMLVLISQFMTEFMNFMACIHYCTIIGATVQDYINIIIHGMHISTKLQSDIDTASLAR